MQNSYVFLDIETTGLNPESDEIIEIGAVLAKNGEIVDRFSTLVNYSGKLPLKIKNLTGITEEMLANAPDFNSVSEQLLEFIGNHPVIGHNIMFDINFLNRKLTRKITNDLADTYEFVQFLLPGVTSYRLEFLKESLDLNRGESHRALSDAESACQLFYKCIDIMSGLDSGVLLEMYRLSEGQDYSVAKMVNGLAAGLLRNFPLGQSGPSYAFMRENRENRSEEQTLFDDKDSIAEGGTGRKLELAGLSDYLEESGPIAKNNSNFKFRQGQADMLQTVLDGFSSDTHMVVEAGTGTGKSLAYLVPSIGWAVQKNTKVVVATHTINLQEQLWDKEIPELKKTARFRFEAALVKGRNNYLCLRRWENKLKELGVVSSDELIFYLKVLIWLTETITGDRSELNIPMQNAEYWSSVCSDLDTCLGPACNWFGRQCFVVKARRQAETADILVVNHSLLLADIKTQNRILPAYDYLVIDEAHHLEASATDQLGWTIGMRALRNTVISFNRGFGGGMGPGILNQIKKAVNNLAEYMGQSEKSRLDSVINDCFEKVKNIAEAVDEIDCFLERLVTTELPATGDEKVKSVRIINNHRNSSSWQVFSALVDNFASRSIGFSNLLKKAAVFFETIPKEGQKNYASLVKDIEYQLGYMDEIVSNLRDFASGCDDNVYWVELNTGAGLEVKLRCSPVSVSKLLHDSIFAVKKSVLLTSATLTVDGSFEHFMERTGLALLPTGSVLTKLLSSPFSYEQQAMLCVVRDLPEPSKMNELEFTEGVVPVIADLARIFGGKTLVLFNSHKMLKEVYQSLQHTLEPDGITILGHRIDGGRTRLMNTFRQNRKSILLGSGSFWEGVDLPGEILKCVVLVRLPFSPPTTPVVEARIEELTRANKDAFNSYTLPEAVLKLKQGFGRLIRTESDEGVVVVLDKRMIDKRYGRKFLNSLPLKTHFRGDTSTVLQKITDWVDGERATFSGLNILGSVKDIDKFLRTQ